MTTVTQALGVCAAIAFLSPALAQDAAVDVATAGRAVAERLCSSCHLVESAAAPSTAQAGVPSMRGLANHPGQSGRRLLDILVRPHSPMPDLRLTLEEITAVVGYLETLRSPDVGAPLVLPAIVPSSPKTKGPT